MLQGESLPTGTQPPNGAGQYHSLGGLVDTDPDVAAVIRHVDEMPNLTDQQSKAQAEQMRHLLSHGSVTK